MDKSKWTDRLPDLMEGYMEAEPEGLWDAVQAGMKPRRRVVAGWWYAAGSLAAAAAVALTVFLWQPRHQDGSPVPGDPVAANTDSSSSVVPPVPSDTLSVDENAPAQPAVPDSQPGGRLYRPVQLTGHAAGEQIAAEMPTEPVDTPAGGQNEPEMHTEPAGTPAGEQNEPETHTEPAGIPAGEQKEPETHTETLPAEWLRPGTVPSTRKKDGKVQLSVTSGGLLAQAGTTTRNGFGLSDAGARSQNGPAAAPMALFSAVHRNKASSTEGKHWQNFRAGLLANYAFTPHWSVETGLQFTSLQSRFTTESGNGNVVEDRHFNYLGIPLNIQFKPLEIGQFSLYVSAGPMFEFLVGGRERSQSFANEMLVYEEEPHALKLRDNRWSLNAGVGLQWQPLSFGAFFIQPGVSWHIPGREDALETFYTARPVSFDLVFGARILLR